MPPTPPTVRDLIVLCVSLMVRWHKPAQIKPPKLGTIIRLFTALLLITSMINLLAGGRYQGFNEFGISALLAQLGVLFISGFLIFPRGSWAMIRTAVSLWLALMCIYGLLLAVMWAVSRLFPAFYMTLPVWSVYGLWLGMVAWILFSAFRAGRLLMPADSSLAGLRLAAGLLLPFLIVPDQPILYGDQTSWSRVDLWNLAQYYLPGTTADDGKADRGRDTDWEKVMYAQSDLINTQLQSIEPSDPDRAQAFFVGMAPYSGQTVFAKEVNAAREIMDRHFNTAGRSIVMENSEDTRAHIALASNSGLVQLMRGLKSKSHPDKDVLVLFVTSHGAKDRIAADDYPFAFDVITPQSLREALAASGFQFRVVILSACHAGSFIDDLKDDHTAILTAAREDRTSFGCSNDRDWTYFGDALFNHGFRQSRSLEGAFSIATKLISDWETRQKIDASEPQIFVGKALSEQWTSMMPGFDQSQSSPAISAGSSDAKASASP